MRQLSFTFATFGVSLFVAAVVFACSDDKSDKTNNNAATGQSPKELFDAIKQPLVATCGGAGGACHVTGDHVNAQGDHAAKWLGPGDPYETAKAYPGIIPITNEPGDSKLLTQIEHDGPALTSIPDLFEGVKKWVTAEVAASGTTHPVTEAFYVKDGANTVNLAALAQGADGAQLTFNAQNTDGTVFVTDMKVTAGAKGVSMTNVTLVILPASGPTRIDAVGGFQGQLTAPANSTVQFYTGDTILQKWNALNRLKIVFDQFSTVDAAPEAGVAGCKAVDQFVANAVPAFKLDLGDGSTCVTCHAAAAPKPDSVEDRAVSTLDLRTIDSTPATACAQALLYVNLADKSKSPLITTPPANDMDHPITQVCGGPPPDPDGGSASPLCVPTSFATSVLNWINAE